MSDTAWIYYCDFYPDVPPHDQDAYQQVWRCCGGPFSERPYGHYADCPAIGGCTGE